MRKHCVTQGSYYCPESVKEIKEQKAIGQTDDESFVRQTLHRSLLLTDTQI